MLHGIWVYYVLTSCGGHNGANTLLLGITLPGSELASTPKAQDRMISLDAFRGAAIIGMILVNNPGRWSMVYPQLRHAPWNGWTFADCVFPFFLFIIGVAMVFSFAKRRESADTSRQIMLRLLRRTCILATGMLIVGFTLFFVGQIMNICGFYGWDVNALPCSFFVAN